MPAEAAQAYLAPLREPRPPALPTPALACDTHFHVFGPVNKFPYAAERAYTPPDAPLEAALLMHAALGIERGVVVQGNPHGLDNSALLDALAREPGRLRGVAIVAQDTTREELRRVRDAGVRALRFHHRPRMEGRHSAIGIDALIRLAPAIEELGLHSQIFMDAVFLSDVMSALRFWRFPVVLDHFGGGSAGFRELEKHLGKGRVWVKVSAVYRISDRSPGYEDARLLHEALVRANPDRLLWGTDWPHTRLISDMPDDGHLLDLFNEWTASEALRKRILIRNPEILYGFP